MKSVPPWHPPLTVWSVSTEKAIEAYAELYGRWTTARRARRVSGAWKSGMGVKPIDDGLRGNARGR